MTSPSPFPIYLTLIPTHDLNDLLRRMRGELDLDAAELSRAADDWETSRNIAAEVAGHLEDTLPEVRGVLAVYGPAAAVQLLAARAEAEKTRAEKLAAAGEVLSRRVDDLETANDGLQVQLETITQREQETVAQLRAQVAQLEQALQVAGDEVQQLTAERLQAHSK